MKDKLTLVLVFSDCSGKLNLTLFFVEPCLGRAGKVFELDLAGADPKLILAGVDAKLELARVDAKLDLVGVDVK